MAETSGTGASVRRVAERELPSFDLVVATIDRVDELEAFLRSLEGQTHSSFRVLVVDQNEDDRLLPVLARHASLDVLRIRSEPGLSRARNAALGQVNADVIAFPDDDCRYAPDLLERVGRGLAADGTLDGLTGRAADRAGRSSASWSQSPALLTRDNLWNRAISFTIFLRRAVVLEIGNFDEELGLGSGRLWSSGEEIDYLVRAVDAGAHIEYDPAIVVEHEDKVLSRADLQSVGTRDGASIGYLLRKHRYPVSTVGKMLIRPAAGALLAAGRRDPAQARFHVSTLRGRLRGYRAA
jgi:glycosyltransferase involved in cell wall biosynthesis